MPFYEDMILMLTMQTELQPLHQCNHLGKHHKLQKYFESLSGY